MIDDVLAACLVVAFPVWNMWKSLTGRRTDPDNRVTFYLRSGVMSVAFLLLLACDWWLTGRSLTILGLDVPVSTEGIIGLIIAIVLIVAQITASWFESRKVRSNPEMAAKVRRASGNILPRNKRELGMWLVLSVLFGCGWELLYRGFLLYFLTPLIGVVGAICLAALAYGAGHGYKTRGQFIGSIAMAFAFTIAYALTRSLWWLMLLHTAFAVVGGCGSYFRERKDDRKGGEASSDVPELA